MGGWHGPASWDPFGDLQREVGRLLGPASWSVPRGVPSVNLYETGGGYVLTVPLPGLSPDEVELSITGETLTLRGERRRPEGVGEESYRRQERVLGRWTRTITLPGRVESDRIAATFVHGLLTVTIPKAEVVAPRQINVKSTVGPGPAG